MRLNGEILCESEKGADPILVRLFAQLHDCKRENEYEDPEHGLRAAVVAWHLYETGTLGIDKWQMAILEIAIRDHNDGKITDDPTIGVCWDADRLDLLRVGIVPHPRFMSTVTGKQRAGVMTYVVSGKREF